MTCGNSGRGDRTLACGLFVPNGGPEFAAVLLSTRGGVLSTIAMRLVRPVRSGGPGFVPFLFPGLRFASEGSDGGSWSLGSGGLDPGRRPASTLWLHLALVLQLLERQPDRWVADSGKGDPHVGDLEDLRRVLEHILTDAVLLRPRRPVGRGPLLEPLVGPREDAGEVRQPGPWGVGLLMPAVGGGQESRIVAVGRLGDELLKRDVPADGVSGVIEQGVRQGPHNTTVPV